MGKKHHMNPAAFIIAKVGDAKAVSKITGSDYTRVCRWRYPEGDSHGTGGIVPHMAAMKLIAWAKAKARREHQRPILGPSDFMKFPSRAA
jgi:hypothetical protein